MVEGRQQSVHSSMLACSSSGTGGVHRSVSNSVRSRRRRCPVHIPRRPGDATRAASVPAGCRRPHQCSVADPPTVTAPTSVGALRSRTPAVFRAPTQITAHLSTSPSLITVTNQSLALILLLPTDATNRFKHQSKRVQTGGKLCGACTMPSCKYPARRKGCESAQRAFDGAVVAIGRLFSAGLGDAFRVAILLGDAAPALGGREGVHCWEVPC